MILSSVLPMSDIPGEQRVWSMLAPSIQNLLHVPMFIGFAYLLNRVLSELPFKIATQLGVVIGGSFIMGIFLEAIQIFIPGRYPGGIDIILNLLGAAIGIIFFRVLQSKKIKGTVNSQSQKVNAKV